MQVTINWLSEVTGKHAATIKKRIANLVRNKAGKVDSIPALEAIYCGSPGSNGEFVSTPEAVRLLTIAKKEQIEIQNQIARSERIPIEDVLLACDIVFRAQAGILKANLNKTLTLEHINEIFAMMRETTEQIRHDYCGNGSEPVNAEPATGDAIQNI